MAAICFCLQILKDDVIYDGYIFIINVFIEFNKVLNSTLEWRFKRKTLRPNENHLTRSNNDFIRYLYIYSKFSGEKLSILFVSDFITNFALCT